MAVAIMLTMVIDVVTSDSNRPEAAAMRKSDFQGSPPSMSVSRDCDNCAEREWVGKMNIDLHGPRRLDRRILGVGEHLSMMLATGEIAGAPAQAIRELQEMPLALLDLAGDATVLLQSRRQVAVPTVLALSCAAGALLFAGAQSIGFGESALGSGELVVAAALAIWASTGP
jgi:hypothetical protein